MQSRRLRSRSVGTLIHALGSFFAILAVACSSEQADGSSGTMVPPSGSDPTLPGEPGADEPPGSSGPGSEELPTDIDMGQPIGEMPQGGNPDDPERFRPKPYVTNDPALGGFPVSTAGESAPLVVSSADFAGVRRVAGHLRADVGRVTGAEPELVLDDVPQATRVIVIGTLGQSPLVDQLVASGQLDVSNVSGRWETFQVSTVEAPFPGVAEALVITGSDKRGTIYGMYDLAREMGVSPWYWWADVPARQSSEVFVLPGAHTKGEPAVKYRGIFINDEAPALSGWAYEQFGGFNSRFYERVFELVMRLKGNYLWPAMWGRAFNDDDPQNPALADEYGVIMGTSHHEPMSRSQDEWNRYGSGDWNYETNANVLNQFWRAGIARMGTRESIVTLGMRGDGDEPLSDEANIAVLENIVDNQRRLIAEASGRAVTSIPQVWTLYKEVQEYYDLGMRVPDDVILLFSDDNFGNVRKLPRTTDAPRGGGYGMYYHYDYVGGPRNYKWLNTNPISRVWEQMHLTIEHGVDRIWIVNVGDIKPMEFPTTFFLDYAWAPNQWPVESLEAYTRYWAEAQFGSEHAAAIGDIISKYTKHNGRRKPELLAPETFSLVDYREAETVVADYNAVAAEAQRVSDLLPVEHRDAFFQLVAHPAQACANLNELYVTAAQNRLYAQQGRTATNRLAARVEELFARDAELSRVYNQEIAGGRWNHMMDQTHIGYDNWQEPPVNNMPAVQRITLPAAAEMGVALEGSTSWWPAQAGAARLPELSPVQAQPGRYIEVFNRGQADFTFTASAAAPWITLTPSEGTVDEQTRLWVSVDWSQVPAGARQDVPITLTASNGRSVVVQAPVSRPAFDPEQLTGFIEHDGFVSIEAEHFTRAVDGGGARWQLLPDLGRTLSAMTVFPTTAPSQTPGGESPHLEYRMQLTSSGPVTVRAYLSPTLNYHVDSLRYAVSFDEQAPQVVSLHGDLSERTWEGRVANNIQIETTSHTVAAPGEHVLRFWMVDAGVVLQKLVVQTGTIKPSYFGPPESYFRATPIAPPVSPPLPH